MPAIIPFVFIGAAVFLASFFYFKNYVKKRTSQDVILAEIRDQVNSIINALNEVTDRNITLMEDKEQSLKTLLEDVEKRLQVYSHQLDRSLTNEKIYSELGKQTKNKPVEQAGSAVLPDLFAEQEKPQILAEAAPEPVPETPPKIEEPSVGDQIRHLYHSGFSAAVIASKLGISISEAELALALLERKSF